MKRRRVTLAAVLLWTVVAVIGSPVTAAESSMPTAPIVDLFRHGMHGLTAQIYVTDRSATHTSIRVYVHRGATPPGTDNDLPSSMPLFVCQATACHKRTDIALRHLPDLAVYSASAYAVSGGHVARTTFVGQVATTGTYLGETDRIKGHSGAGTAVVRDPQGTVHIVKGHRYFTRRPGAAHWTSTKVVTGKSRPVLFRNSPDASGVTLDGRRVFFAVKTCDGLGVLEAPLAARRLGKPSVVVPSEHCSSHERFFAGAIALPHDNLGLLLNDTYYVGTPGGTWQAQSLPNVPANTGFGSVTRDAATGEVLAAGFTARSGALDVNVWSLVPGGTWQGPVLAASLTTPNRPSNIVADRGRVWIAFTENQVSETSGTVVTSEVLVSRINDTCSRPSTVPNSLTETDSSGFADTTSTFIVAPTLAINPATHHLHLAYANTEPFYVLTHTRAEGVFHQFLKGGTWSKPRQLTHFWDDTPLHMIFNAAGHVILLLHRRA